VHNLGIRVPLGARFFHWLMVAYQPIAGGAQNTANADAVLKNFYLGPIREQLNQRAILMFASEDEGEPDSSTGENIAFRGLSRESERVEFAGRQWIIPAHKSRNEGVGAIDEGGTIPVAGQQGWVDLQDSLRHNLGAIELTRYAIRLSNRNPGAFIRLLEGETKGLVRDLRKDVNRQAWGSQTGTLATVTADGANTVTVDTVQYLRVGMRVDIIDSTNDTVLASNRTLSAVNATTKVVTYSGADATATTNHRLCRTGSWKREIHGLGSLIGNTGTVHNVDSTAAGNEWWKSVVSTAGGLPFDEDTGQQVIDGVGGSGNGEVELLISTRGVRRRYVNTLKSQKRFNDRDSVILRGGFKAVMFNEFPLAFDDDCPKGVMVFLNTEALMWVYLPNGDQPGNWDWVDDDGAILTRKADRTDAFEAYLAADHNLATTARNQLGKITGLEDDTAGVWS
jgi:hypothetical protein